MLSSEYDQSQTLDVKPIKTRRQEGITKPKTQAKRVKKKDEGSVNKKGLMTSLRASARGVKIPSKEGLFGPRRNIIYAKTFRSRRVKKATDNKKEKRESRGTIK